MRNVNDGIIPNDHEFMLYEHDKDGNIVEVVYKGVWFIVDNGYLSWSCTAPPVKGGMTYAVIRFSEWLESMRKDVECTFGILKGRFSILRYGFRFAKIEQCDQLWLTCCALHNMLLFVDGLDKNWENGVASDWERFNSEFSKENSVIPFAISKLNRHLIDKMVEIQPEEPSGGLDHNFKKYTVGNRRIVSKMPLSLFQQCLVNHFDIRFKQNTIVWPRHMKLPQKLR